MGKDNLVRSFLGIITFTVMVFALEYLSEILIPLVVAAVFSVMFKPLIVVLSRRKIPIPISLLIVVFILAFSFYIFGALLYSSSKPLISVLPAYSDKLSLIVASALDVLTELGQKFSINIENIDIQALAGATSLTADALSDTVSTFLDFIGHVALVLIFILFMLAGIDSLKAKVKMAYPSDKSDKINDALQNIEVHIRKYLVIKILLNGVTGLLTFIALWLLGVGFPVFWGVVAFLVSFIPTVGAVIAIGMPFVLSLLQFDDLTIPFLVILILGIVYMVMGSLVEPKFMAATLNLSALLIMVSLIFWGLVWGPLGMILAIPLTTIIKIIFENIEPLKPISILMGAKTE